jgi:hypothetical protein
MMVSFAKSVAEASVYRTGQLQYRRLLSGKKGVRFGLPVIQELAKRAPCPS